MSDPTPTAPAPEARETSGPRGEDRQVVGVKFSPTGRVIDCDSGSSVSPSPMKHQTLRSVLGISPRASRYFQLRAW